MSVTEVYSIGNECWGALVWGLARAYTKANGKNGRLITLRIKIQSAHVSKFQSSQGLFREALLLKEKHDKRQDGGHHGKEEATVCLC